MRTKGKEKVQSEIPDREAALADRKFWTQQIAPKGAALLSQTLRPCLFVIKNHGSNDIKLVAQHGDLMDLPPGAVRATYARGTVTVENSGDEPALIEFEFLPIFLVR
jgi:hypothetical protein